ncbi:MAG: MSCRAMM family protein [Actinomycetota bacterium]
MSRRARPLYHRPLASGLALLVAAAALLLARPDAASAAVTHLHGFRATVDGFTSWYGSYAMGELGTAWCIDHGIRAPDPAYRYAPADLSAVPPDVQSALGWAVATHGRNTDRVRHAALMLALHDLMGAHYPSGRLDVDRLAINRLAGFGGAESQVLSTARAIKADALAHAALRGPLRLSVVAGPVGAAGTARITARITDANGMGVAGVAISFAGSSPGLSAASATTGADGSVALTFRASGAPATVRAAATVPHLPVDAWAPTTTRAQRVARPAVDQLTGSATVAPATGQLLVIKRGDATAWAPVAGARFRIEPPGGGTALQRVTSGADGKAGPVSLPIGSYRVVEEQAPPGYAAAGPWSVVVQTGRITTLEAANSALRGRLVIRKVDAGTGAALPGASLRVRYDSDADGTFDEVVAEVVTTDEPTTVEGLLPGRYEITETAAPDGYERLAERIVVDLAAGASVEVVIDNEPVPPPTTTTTAPPTTTTTVPPTTAPPTTTVPPTTAPAATPVTVLAAAPTPPPPPAAPALPRTGVDALTLALFGSGLVLVGRSLVEAGRSRQPRAPRSRRSAMRLSS